ncbi:hypothetical protein NMY22_g9740 [Coprinellus aureogranulatus]|nr:hypothetical protein NMY22_g9740 [Coprinellus aureogranulatus]
MVRRKAEKTWFLDTVSSSQETSNALQLHFNLAWPAGYIHQPRPVYAWVPCTSTSRYFIREPSVGQIESSLQFRPPQIRRRFDILGLPNNPFSPLGSRRSSLSGDLGIVEPSGMTSAHHPPSEHPLLAPRLDRKIPLPPTSGFRTPYEFRSPIMQGGFGQQPTPSALSRSPADFGHAPLQSSRFLALARSSNPEPIDLREAIDRVHSWRAQMLGESDDDASHFGELSRAIEQSRRSGLRSITSCSPDFGVIRPPSNRGFASGMGRSYRDEEAVNNASPPAVDRALTLAPPTQRDPSSSNAIGTTSNPPSLSPLTAANDSSPHPFLRTPPFPSEEPGEARILSNDEVWWR